MRRVLTFVEALAVGLLCGYVAWVLAEAGATASLLTLALALIIKSTVTQVIYLVAPTAEYVSKIAELVRAARGGPQ